MDKGRREVLAMTAGLGVSMALVGLGLEGCTSSGSSSSPSPTLIPSVVQSGFEVPGVGVALADGMRGLSAPEIRNRLLDVKGIGADTVRFDADWWTVTASPGTSGMENIKNTAAEATRLGLRSMVTITGVPPGHRLERYGQAENDPPSSIQEMGSFAKAVVSMLGDLAIMYEYRNETNLYYDPERYAQEINQIYEYIYAGNRHAQLSVCGLAPAENASPTLSPGTFLDRALRAGMKNFHSVGDHVTCNPDIPGSPDAWSGFTQLVGPTQLPYELSVVDALRRNGMSGFPVNISEYAVSTYGNGPKESRVDDQILQEWANNPSNGYATQEFQAASIQKAMTWNYLASGLNVLQLLVYTDRDRASMNYPYAGRQAPAAAEPFPYAFNYNGLFTAEGDPKLIVANGTYQHSAAQFLEMAAARAHHFAR